MKIGIAIPSHMNHIHKLKGLLDNIQTSTVKPNAVSVSCSGYVGEPIKYDDYSFELIIKYTEKSNNASTNRNIAADQLDTDIISFFDCDDIMHPQRIEFILKSFMSNNCNALVHNYLLSNHINDNFMKNRYESISYLHNYVNQPGVYNYPYNVSYPISDIRHLGYANGHISVLKDIFIKYRYDENKLLRYCEDSEYSNRLVINGINISYIYDKLSLYIK
jgi:hypothetical protein